MDRFKWTARKSTGGDVEAYVRAHVVSPVFCVRTGSYNSGIEGLVNSLEQSLHHDPRLADQISHAGIQRLLHILMGIDNHVEGLEIINIQVLSVGILSRRRLHQHSRTRSLC
ncbi:hypothetical protein AgCh_028277 [Apium graveolens]